MNICCARSTSDSFFFKSVHWITSLRVVSSDCVLKFSFCPAKKKEKGSIQNWRFSCIAELSRLLSIDLSFQLILPPPSSSSSSSSQKKILNMLGGGSSSSSQGKGGAFSCSSSAALPPARRHQQQTAAAAAATAAIVAASTCWSPTNPFNVLSSGGSVVVPSTASEDATVEAAAVAHHPFSYANACPTLQPIQRKRPGCSCDHDDYRQSVSAGGPCFDYPLVGDCEHVEPLDLSLPKVKVRQHWSGGSIVQVNDSTIISIDRRPEDGSAGLCCSAGCAASNAAGQHSPSTLNVSVVTVPQQRPSCWPQSLQQATIDRHPQHPFRLQIEIPFGASDERALPGFSRHTHRRRSVHAAAANHNNPPASSGCASQQLLPADIATSVMTEAATNAREEDDLQRLSIVSHQLRLSGYYYGHLSWKESVQLLQNTKVGTFLVRDSSDARYLYALSLQTDKGPTSVRIHYSSRGFRLDASNTGMADHLPRFRTVLDLIDHYVAKWSQCRDKGQFWLDNSGQVHSEVVLIRPLRRDCPSLKHLCRLAWNGRRSEPSANPSLSPSSSANIPPAIKSFLNEYPFQH